MYVKFNHVNKQKQYSGEEMKNTISTLNNWRDSLDGKNNITAHPAHSDPKVAV